MVHAQACDLQVSDSLQHLSINPVVPLRPRLFACLAKQVSVYSSLARPCMDKHTITMDVFANNHAITILITCQACSRMYGHSKHPVGDAASSCNKQIKARLGLL